MTANIAGAQLSLCLPCVAISYVSYAWSDRTYSIVRNKSGHTVCVRMWYRDPCKAPSPAVQAAFGITHLGPTVCKSGQSLSCMPYVWIIWIMHETEGIWRLL